MEYSAVLNDSIEMEKAGEAYVYQKEDGKILAQMLKEVNKLYRTNFHYLAEMEAFHVRGSGEIMINYINQFRSEEIRAIIISHLVQDRVKGCEYTALQGYMHFKASDEYISAQGKPSPAHIHTRYDNAFRKLKPKRLKQDLLSLAGHPRDAYYLPFTMQMLASWHCPSLEEILISYAGGNSVTYESVGLPDKAEGFFPPLYAIKRELLFTALGGLKYYPSERVYEILNTFSKSPDKDIAYTANKSLRYLEKHSVECGGKDSWITC